MKIFVYGTLKMGYWNNHIIEDKTYIGDGIIEGYKLTQGGIPYAYPSEGDKIKGEIWDIGDDNKCLDNLDRLEGHPNWYRRTPVVTLDGQDVSLYVMQGEERGKDCPKNAKGEYYWD